MHAKGNDTVEFQVFLHGNMLALIESKIALSTMLVK